VFPKWAWSGSREQFLHCGLRKFRHTKSSVDRWYTQLDHRRFVYDAYKTLKATRVRHGWVHMFIAHQPTLTFQLHNFNLFRTCHTALLHGNWPDFNRHDASHGPTAITKLLVFVFLLWESLCWDCQWNQQFCHSGLNWFFRSYSRFGGVSKTEPVGIIGADFTVRCHLGCLIGNVPIYSLALLVW